MAKKSKSTNVSSRYPNEELLSSLRMMLLIRRFEEKAGQLYGMGLIGGFCHLCIGQEAIYAGIQAALEEGDQVITSYRDHGLMLATGSDPKGVMAELTGGQDGVSKGKGGSMHMFDLAKGFYGGHGIVGAQVPIGTGMAFANKYRKNGKISVTYFGDGALNQGQVYESFNMAKLWDLPVLYVLENNEYAMGTSTKRSCSVDDLYLRGKSFGIEGLQVDGMDYLAVREAATEAIDKIRKGGSPVLLEMKTYRYRGHSMSDPAKYRSKDEVQKVKDERDPINNLRDYLIQAGITTEEEFKALDKEIRAEVAEVAEFAKNSPDLPPEELYTDIYVN